MASIVEDEVIKAEMQDGLSQVDSNLAISEFETDFDSISRTMRVYFKAINKETGETVTFNYVLR